MVYKSVWLKEKKKQNNDETLCVIAHLRILYESEREWIKKTNYRIYSERSQWSLCGTRNADCSQCVSRIVFYCTMYIYTMYKYEYEERTMWKYVNAQPKWMAVMAIVRRMCHKAQHSAQRTAPYSKALRWSAVCMNVSEWVRACMFVCLCMCLWLCVSVCARESMEGEKHFIATY